MNLDSDELLAQIQKDWPAEYELSTLRKLVEVQDREIQRLSGLQPGTAYGSAGVRPYVEQSLADADSARHGS